MYKKWYQNGKCYREKHYCKNKCYQNENNIKEENHKEEIINGTLFVEVKNDKNCYFH